MKKITYLIFISGLTFSQGLMAGQFCDNSVPNEWPDSRYFVEEINGDQVVTDNKTGLMWQRCILGFTPVNLTCEFIQGSTPYFTWQEALESAQALNDNGGYADYTDWRVPNIRELTTLVATNCAPISANSTAFPSMIDYSQIYLSSSPSPYEARFNGLPDTGKAVWTVHFQFGEISGSWSQQRDGATVYLVRGSGY